MLFRSREVEPVWTYRFEQATKLGVKVRLATSATVESIKAYGPDFVVVATGARPRACPFDVSGLDSTVKVLHAWDVLANPAQLANAQAVTIIGGGMVGVETADLLSEQGKRCTIIEALSSVANGMARNNRMELLDRLKLRGVRIMLGSAVATAAGRQLDIRSGENQAHSIEIGDCLVIATGPAPDTSVVSIVEAAGVEYALAGDCNQPGDFLSCLRDAWMVALSLEHRFDKN